MGVDIYIKSGRASFSCRLYWISNLINRYGWKYKGEIPALELEKKLNLKGIKLLLDFSTFCRSELLKNNKKDLAKFDSGYFKKTKGIGNLLKRLIDLIKSKPNVDKKVLIKLAGLLRRLESFADIYSDDAGNVKEEIEESYEERISQVEKLILLLTRVVSKGGSVRIG